jgi:predicted ATPase
MLSELTIAGYRSLREITLPLGRLTVIVGANGCGKSNLHRSLYLLHAAAQGRLARTMASEGGMSSLLWAGARHRGPVRLKLGIITSENLSYELVCGLPEPNDLPSRFKLDPLIKEESILFREGGSLVTLMDRGKSGVMLRDSSGKRVSLPMTLSRHESALMQISEPHRYPHLSLLRDRLSGWRFYHHFRTDDGGPLRQPQVGVFTPALAHDGADLAAALLTIQEIGDRPALEQAIRSGLSGAELEIVISDDYRFRVLLHTPGLHRPLEAWEMSDGTLRYLCLLAALLSPRPPQLLALNEPETSLHPDLIPPLAAAISQAASRCQIWLATHSVPLSDAIQRFSGIPPVRLIKTDGETRIAL